MKPFDENGKFQCTPTEVSRRAVKGAGSTVLSSLSGVGIQLVSTMILARLLVPADFGLVAMVSAFSLLLVNWGINGFTEAVLQADAIDHRLASNLFWINVGSSSVLAIGFALAGRFLARFYGDPRVTGVTAGMAIPIVITGASVLHLALLKRAMRFPALSANDVFARLMQVAISILLSWKGWGYWALVAGAVTLSLSTCIGAWLLCRWLPGLPRRGIQTVPMVRFAVHTYGRFTANYFANNVDNLLVGWRFGATPLGFYKKAYDLFALPVGLSTAPLTNVAVSALSRVRDDAAKYKRYLTRAVGVVAFLGMGLAAEITLVGKDLIRLLLGPGWEPAGRLLMFFGPAIGVMTLYYIHGWIHLSIGKADRWFRWGLIEAGVTLVLFGVALRFGPVGVAVAWSTSFFILTIPAFWYAGKPIGVGVKPMIEVVWRFLAAGVIAGCLSGLVASYLPALNVKNSTAASAFRLTEVSIVLLMAYLTAVICLHRGLAPLRDFAKLLPDALPWAKYKTRRGVPAGNEVTASV